MEASILISVTLVLYVVVTQCLGSCFTVYGEGGAWAVLHSSECPPHDTLVDYANSSNCQIAMLQGPRKSLEDRSLCARISFPGEMGLKEVDIGIAAVFDGHNGAEASEMASKLLLGYFGIHTYFLLDASYASLLTKSVRSLPNEGVNDFLLQEPNHYQKLNYHGLSAKREETLYLDVLKEALLRSLHDIDETFSEEASRLNLASGSTAVVALIVDGQILVASIGDSKALLCSEESLSPSKAKETLLMLYREQRRDGASPDRNALNFRLAAASNGMAHFVVEKLNRDHHLDREDEKVRVESAGGNVTEWGGNLRVNDQLIVSRSIGDVHLKRYGVISTPEVTEWKPLTTNHSYLVVASDGMFEKLSFQGVCDILWESRNNGTERSPCSYPEAECLVNIALEKGSMDNVAAVVVSLPS